MVRLWKVIILGSLFVSWSLLAEEIEGISLEGIELEQIAELAKQGSLLIVKLDDKGGLKEVVAGALVNAPKEKVWEVLVDFEHYPNFIPHCKKMRVIKELAENQVITEQEVIIEFWVLKFEIRYELFQRLEPNKGIRFSNIAGDLSGSYGGYDLVSISGGNQTLLFYYLYSNLTALPWPVGAIMKSQADFMIAVNASTASIVVQAMKEEAEQRAGACK